MIGKNILSEEKRVWFILGSEITRKKKKKGSNIYPKLIFYTQTNHPSWNTWSD